MMDEAPGQHGALIQLGKWNEQPQRVYAGKRLQVLVHDEDARLYMDHLFSSGRYHARAKPRAYRDLAGNPKRGVVEYVSGRVMPLEGSHGQRSSVFIDIYVDREQVARIYQHSTANQHTLFRYLKDWTIQTKLRGESLEAQRKWDRGGWLRVELVDQISDPPVLAAGDM